MNILVEVCATVTALQMGEYGERGFLCFGIVAYLSMGFADIFYIP